MSAQGTVTGPVGYDVVCGGGRHSGNPGNAFLNQLSEVKVATYKAATSKATKHAILNEIYDAIASRNGRFIEKPKGSTTFTVLSKEVALGKIKQKFKRYSTNAAAAKGGPGGGPQTPSKVSASATRPPMASPAVAPVVPPFPPQNYQPPPQAPSITQNQFIVVARNRLLKGGMNLDHAFLLMKDLTFPSEQARQQGANLLLGQLQSEKTFLKDWAREKVQDAMAVQAQKMNLQYTKDSKTFPVKTFEDVALSWETDNSEENQNKIYQVLYGQFGPDWIRQLETRFMQEKRLVYPDKTSSNGYVYSIISLALSTVQQGVKTKGLKRHGIWMGTDNARTLGTPGRKRQKTGEHTDGESVSSSVGSTHSGAAAAAAAAAAETSQKKKPASSKKKTAPSLLSPVPEDSKKKATKQGGTMTTPSAATIKSAATAATPSPTKTSSKAPIPAVDSDDERRDAVTASLLEQTEPSITQQYVQVMVISWILFVLAIMYWFGR